MKFVKLIRIFKYYRGERRQDRCAESFPIFWNVILTYLLLIIVNE